MNWIEHLGQYTVLMAKTFSKPDRHKMFLKRLVDEIVQVGVNSIGIVAIISMFIGAVITIQTAYNMENPLLPNYTVSLITRDTLLLEFSSTILCMILAGKIGSRIASEIGTMRVTEQIDALEIMGVNSANFLILPKITALVLSIPFLVMISMFLGLVGGYIGGSVLVEAVSSNDYLMGIQYFFVPYYITYAIIKSLVFAFIITSVSAYFGYYSYGGAFEVGDSSTKAVVRSTVIVLFFDVVLTQLLLQ